MIPKPRKMTESQKQDTIEFYPSFISEKIIELNTYPEINDQPSTKITDFYPLCIDIWKISNPEYQERYWVRQEPPMMGDNYMETLETFLSMGEAVLMANDAERVSMTTKQREMLQRLYNMIEDFEGDVDTPDDPGYGLNDSAIIADPKWHKIQAYAKLVYEEITGDDLDAWERSRPKRAQPPKIQRRDATPEELQAEEKKIYPSFLFEQFNRRQIIPETSLEHFLINVYLEVWTMSNKEYQERFWVRKEFPIYDDENCMKTSARFLCDVGTVIRGYENGKIPITSNQCESLKILSLMIEKFQKDPNKPNDPGFGINDSEIIECKQWRDIRSYAKLVYEELEG